MFPEFDVIAVLGRGIERVLIGRVNFRWRPTALVEKCKPSTGEHLGLKEIGFDINHPDCLIGGGNANVLAGLELFEKRGAHAVLFAYGARSDYLRLIDAPSEGEIMMLEFVRRLGRGTQVIADTVEPQVIITDQSEKSPGLYDVYDGKIVAVPFDGRILGVELRGGLKRYDGTPSNTFTELDNVFGFAVDRGYKRIALITVSVHVPRVIVFASSVKKQKPRYAGIELSYFDSEGLLMNRSPRYQKFLDAMRPSAAYYRNQFREWSGIQAFCEGKYRSVQGNKQG